MSWVKAIYIYIFSTHTQPNVLYVCIKGKNNQRLNYVPQRVVKIYIRVASISGLDIDGNSVHVCVCCIHDLTISSFLIFVDQIL